MSAPEHLTAALQYASRGRAVFPLRPGSKQPIVDGGFKSATTDRTVIQNWWTRWPLAGIGCATGAVSGFWSLDVDADKDGEATIAELEDRHGRLPPTVELLTGGGGRQLFFRHKGLFGIGCTVQKIGPGVDTRADGGYTILPPSIHPSGRRYEWSVDGHPDETSLAWAPIWLYEMVKAEAKKTAAPPAEWRQLAEGKAPEGQRNITLTRLAGHLLRRDIDSYVTLSLLRAWNAAHCDPPLSDDEVVQTVASICRLEEQRRKGAA